MTNKIERQVMNVKQGIAEAQCLLWRKYEQNYVFKYNFVIVTTSLYTSIFYTK